MDEFIDFVNSFYGKNKSIEEILQQIIFYNKEHQCSIKSEWLDDKRILFNDSSNENKYLITYAKQILDNKLTHDELNVRMAKQQIFKKRANEENGKEIKKEIKKEVKKVIKKSKQI